MQQKAGLFEVANGGTLFLDEIGELPPMMQVKLLRVLQEREFRRVGGTRDIQVDVRLIAATNKDLEAEVSRGAFREDLFYRLNVIRINLPPLRERREDLPLLIEHLFKKLTGADTGRIADGAMRRLLDYHWPGNIRELENFLERCVVLGQTGEITEDHLPPQMQGRAVDLRRADRRDSRHRPRSGRLPGEHREGYPAQGPGKDRRGAQKGGGAAGDHFSVDSLPAGEVRD